MRKKGEHLSPVSQRTQPEKLNAPHLSMLRKFLSSFASKSTTTPQMETGIDSLDFIRCKHEGQEFIRFHKTRLRRKTGFFKEPFPPTKTARNDDRHVSAALAYRGHPVPCFLSAVSPFPISWGSVLPFFEGDTRALDFEQRHKAQAA